MGEGCVYLLTKAVALFCFAKQSGFGMRAGSRRELSEKGKLAEGQPRSVAQNLTRDQRSNGLERNQQLQRQQSGSQRSGAVQI